MESLRSTLGDVPILFEDDELLVVVKPAGLPTANAARDAESLYVLLRRRPTEFIGVVSRLDAPVSGLVVLAKSPRAAAGLAAQFRDRAVEKAYSAIVTGRFPAPLGTWADWHDEMPRRTDAAAAGRSAAVDVESDSDSDSDVADAAGLAAHTRARVVRRAGEVSLVQLEPSTGRRHQLRLQLASRGCPIVGDRRYGSRLPCPAGGIALHASRLAFEHPTSGATLAFASHCRSRWQAAFPSLFS